MGFNTRHMVAWSSSTAPEGLVNTSDALQTDIMERCRRNFPDPLFYEAILYGHLHILSLHSEDGEALPPYMQQVPG